jgi:hypothetical protein
MSARENRFLLKEPTSTISYYNLSSIDNGIGKNKTPARTQHAISFSESL